MRTIHGALLLVVAMVLLSTGICTSPVPAPGPGLDEFPSQYAPGPGLDEFPSEYAPGPGAPKHAPAPAPDMHSCFKILYSGDCDAKKCLNKCSSELKGDGICVHKTCKCSYKCKTNPPVDI